MITFTIQQLTVYLPAESVRRRSSRDVLEMVRSATMVVRSGFVAENDDATRHTPPGRTTQARSSTRSH